MEVIKPLWTYKQTPMSDELAKSLLMLLTEVTTGDESFSDDILKNTSLFPITRIFIDLMKQAELTNVVTKQVKTLILLLLLLENKNVTPSDVELYTIALRMIADEEGQVDLEKLTFKFAMGFPNKTELENAWDDLKQYRYTKDKETS
ncbi:hypothetical protein [Photobacterium leiognathi]|uniref:hypothetical protein n=1 Tax=Photobacterium leiognathi TaxID=553611 RepID=UPI0029820D1E|nr:hypothetical protein [Photobacterium leiognathi]